MRKSNVRFFNEKSKEDIYQYFCPFFALYHGNNNRPDFSTFYQLSEHRPGHGIQEQSQQSAEYRAEHKVHE